MSVTAAGGFRAAGTACGIKPSGDLDLALVAAERPVPASGVFTTNRAAAPPVLVSRSHLASGRARAVFLNSGCANAGTGDAGRQDVTTIARRVAEALGSGREEEVVVCSTGPIGSRLLMPRMFEAIPSLVRRLDGRVDGGRAAAKAILTTDTHPEEVTIRSTGFVVGGMAKGAGMLRPDLATMLAVLTTDALVEGSSLLSSVLRAAVEGTFNALDVDGCQSTNDAVVLLASGDSGVAPSAGELAEAVEEACRTLARSLAGDAEGATKVVTLLVSGTEDAAVARRLGRAVADSALVGASFWGGDPNWGRMLGALRAAGVDLDLDRVTIAYQGVPVVAAGVAVPCDHGALSLDGDFTVELVVGAGPRSAEVVTTDLTPEYVVLNGEPS